MSFAVFGVNLCLLALNVYFTWSSFRTGRAREALYRADRAKLIALHETAQREIGRIVETAVADEPLEGDARQVALDNKRLRAELERLYIRMGK